MVSEKTKAGEAFLSAKSINLPVGIKANSYVVTDFSDEKKLCELVVITCEELKEKLIDEI